MQDAHNDQWEFWIDVGGTFTDCIGRRGDGELLHCKVLSSGAVKGTVCAVAQGDIVDDGLPKHPSDFFAGYTFVLLDDDGNPVDQRPVVHFEIETPALILDGVARVKPHKGQSYELRSGEPAPILGIRRLLGLKLDDLIPPCRVRLGTTRGTNALLEHKGADVAWITTKGFADLLQISTQARPHLFDLEIQKPPALHKTTVELDERIDATGQVLQALSESQVRQALQSVRDQGIESLAVCLLNAYANPEHEDLVASVAEQMDFQQVSVSTRLSPTIKMLDRGDTAVVDAYLSPVISDYLRQVGRVLGPSDLKMMSSSGGLMNAENFAGKDSIFSGPAGGVVGFARATQLAGFDQAIGFDMGGTSTDVSRFDGRYEYQFTTEKAGARIVAPMYAIETVAAGGGSICGFDGQRLTVGPHSAGADPGPACYGRGGPITVTDINLVNGKIDREHFPFPLEEQTVIEQLQQMCHQIERATGQAMTVYELADGFTGVANEKMAGAIKRISAQRGYDPAEYALVCFGGAAAQHGCAIARSLGMTRILLHPLAGILSAFGLGMADVRRFADQTVLTPYSPEALKELEAQIKSLAGPLIQQVVAEGIAEDRIETQTMLDLRYQGEDATITVTESNDDSYLSQFENLHEQLYGHRHQGRDVEIVNLRVEVIGHTAKPKLSGTQAEPHIRNPKDTRGIYFDAKRQEAGFYRRARMRPGDSFTGPALVVEPFSTIVVDPEWQATMTEQGDLLLEFDPQEEPDDKDSDTNARSSGPQAVACDPIRLELFNNQFTQIATQMGLTLQRTSLSVNVKERLDFSCAVLGAGGELICNAPHIPVHLGAMSQTVKSLLTTGVELKPAQVYVSNDPALGGSHLPDVTVMTPVFDPDGKTLRFFTASRAHHAEIGGLRPGSTYPFASCLAEEGVVLSNLLIVEEGHFLDDALRNALGSGPYPSRSIDENIADIKAAVAANHQGATLLLQMIDRQSWAVVEAYMKHIRDAAERKTRQAIARLPHGSHEFEDTLDDGAPIRVHIDISEQGMHVDFTGSGPVHPMSLNANRAIVQSAILYCLRCLIDQDIPLNSGVLAPIELTVPQGMLSPPIDPDPTRRPAVVGGNVEVSQRIVDVIFGALGVAAASQGTMNNFVFGNERFGYYETICGGCGAGPDYNGAHAVHSHMTNTLMTDVEVFERRYPVRLLEFSRRRGSGGQGRFRGGDGVIRRVEFLETLEVSLLTQRRLTAPFGMAGGDAGAPGRNLLHKAGDKEPQTLEPLCHFQAAPGDVLTIETPGGGGFGEKS